jgi:hypothetical protein
MRKYPFDFEYLAQKLDKIIEVKDGNIISFNDIFLKNDIESILESAYDFNAEIPELQKPIIIEEGISNFAINSIKNSEQLKRQIKKSEVEFLKKPSERFSLLSSFSFPYFEELQNVRYMNGGINLFRYGYPKKYKYKILNDELKKYSDSIPPHGYVPLVIKISARNYLEAVERGMDFIDIIRGIWNYSINRRVSSRMTFGLQDPINMIRLGPTLTLHFSNGKLACEQFWHELNYYQKSSTWDVAHRWQYISKEFLFIRKALKKLPYRNQFNKMFIRYTRALDSDDYETSYLKLWPLLEYLTDTINSNYDKTISRALFFYRDDVLSKELIEHLRLFRNKTVHTGETNRDLVPLLFQIKRIIERIIWFHLKLAGKFDTIEEFGKFLDLSKNKINLEGEILLREKALKFLYK